MHTSYRTCTYHASHTGLLEVYLKYGAPPSFHYGEWDFRCVCVHACVNLYMNAWVLHV